MRDAGLVVDQPQLRTVAGAVHPGRRHFDSAAATRSPSCKPSADDVFVFAYLHTLLLRGLDLGNAHLSSSKAASVCHVQKPAAILGPELGTASAD